MLESRLFCIGSSVVVFYNFAMITNLKRDDFNVKSALLSAYMKNTQNKTTIVILKIRASLPRET